MSTDDWIKSEFEKEAKTPSLEKALLRQAMRPYVGYRLRFFFLRVLSIAFVHAIELPFILHSVSTASVPTVLLFAAAMHLVAQCWWAALESMRLDVRDLVDDKRAFQVGRMVSRWIRTSFLVALLLLLLGAAATVALCRLSRFPYYSPEMAVMLVFLIRTILDIPITTYYSGIYAVRRVNRPIMVVFLVDILGLAAAFAMRPWLGGWAFPISLFFFGFVQMGLGIYFIQRMYRFVGWDVPFPFSAEVRPQSIKALAERRVVICGLAGIVMALDSLLIIGLSIPHGQQVDRNLVVLLFLVAPFLRACHDWAILFFPDIRRMNLELFQHLHRKFIKSIQITAWLVAVVCWILSVAVAYVVLGSPAMISALLLLPLFVVRSLLAFAQIKAFSTQHFVDIIVAGLFFIAGAYLLPLFITSEKSMILSLSLLYLPIISLTALRRFRLIRDSSADSIELPSNWFFSLRSSQSKMKVCLISLSFDSTTAERHRIVRYLAEAVFPSGSVTTLKERMVLVYSPRPEIKERIVKVLIHAAGSFDAVRWFRDPADCASWVHNMLREKVKNLGGGNDELERDWSEQSAIELFQRKFPDGKVINLHRDGADGTKSGQEVPPAVLGAAIAFAKTWQHHKTFVSVLMDRDIISTIFFIPAGDKARGQDARNWEHYLAFLNFKLATRPAAAPAAAAGGS